MTPKKRGPNAYLAPTHYFLCRISRMRQPLKTEKSGGEVGKEKGERRKLYNVVG